MTPRQIPDPISSVPMAVAFCLSTVAAVFLAAWRLTQYGYERITKEKQ